MDSFVKITKQKKKDTLSLHDTEINLLKKYIKEKKNVFICGSIGVGKSYVLNSILDESNSIEIYDINTQKKTFFFHELKETNLHVYIDNYENDLQCKKIIEDISENNHKISQGCFIVTSKNVHILNNFTTLIVKKCEPEQIMKIQSNHPNTNRAAEKCLGNIHNYFHYLDFDNIKDLFRSPKELILDLFYTDRNIDISDSLHEHGHIWSVIHENYPDFIEESYEHVILSISDADVYDTYLYEGIWEFMCYFSLHAIKIPKMYFTKINEKKDIRPGSVWTKYGNQKMRYQKVKDIIYRSNRKININDFYLLREYAKKDDVSHFKHYNLTPQDFDLMNHLALHNKLKQREVTRIKKMIKEEIIN
jgi:hypothetical protein